MSALTIFSVIQVEKQGFLHHSNQVRLKLLPQEIQQYLTSSDSGMVHSKISLLLVEFSKSLEHIEGAFIMCIQKLHGHFILSTVIVDLKHFLHLLTLVAFAVVGLDFLLFVHNIAISAAKVVKVVGITKLFQTFIVLHR